MKHLQKFKIFENLAQAKSIINKNKTPENEILYNEILELTEKDGYTGLVTRLIIQDKNDKQEIFDLYKDIKNKKIDLSKINSLSYNDILDIVYSDRRTDYILFKELPLYNIYKILSYDGIMQIGSPAWCLKTKSMFDKYTTNAEQYVAISKKAIKNDKINLVSPVNFYGDDYRNTKNPNIRYGLTIQQDKIYIFDDNNNSISEYSEISKYLLKNIGVDLSSVNVNYSLIVEQIVNVLDEYNVPFSNIIFNDDEINENLDKIKIELCEIFECNEFNEIINILLPYKEELLKDDNITQHSGYMDIIMCEIFGKYSFDLGGYKLKDFESNIGDEMGSFEYKYSYGFHHTHYGRLFIEQSYNNVDEWLTTVAKKAIFMIFNKDFTYVGHINKKYENIEKDFIDHLFSREFNIKNIIIDIKKIDNEEYKVKYDLSYFVEMLKPKEDMIGYFKIFFDPEYKYLGQFKMKDTFNPVLTVTDNNITVELTIK